MFDKKYRQIVCIDCEYELLPYPYISPTSHEIQIAKPRMMIGLGDDRYICVKCGTKRILNGETDSTD